MSFWQLALKSFLHYRKTNLAIVLGVAAATAVLTGALLVGESMRTSLRNLALDRLGETDQILVSQGFFKASNFQHVDAEGGLSIPAILFNNGTVELETESGTVSRATNVNVFGIPKDFWNIDPKTFEGLSIADDNAIINQALAEQLSHVESAELTLRIPKPTQLPSESALGAKSNLVESIVGIKVANVVPNQGFGRFGLHPSQLDTPNIFVPIELLQDALSRKALRHKSDSNQANVVFRKLGDASDAEQDSKLSVVSLEDEGLLLKEVAVDHAGENAFQYWSLSSDQLVLRPAVVRAIEKTFPSDSIKPVFTYLANDIRLASEASGIPFSMVSAIDIADDFPLLDTAGNRIEALVDNQIVLNEWAAGDIGASVGDELVVTWFDPETTHGQQSESSATFTVTAIAKLTQPKSTFRVRRGKVTPPSFESAPTLANDWYLTPEVPGVSDAASIEDWDLPFETASKIRAADDDYWGLYRTAPKAFVSLATGQKLWGSRFGNVTSFRIPNASGERKSLEKDMLASIAATPGATSFDLIPIRENAVRASSGSTPFDVLFLALSMFVIVSGLVLVSLLFRLALQSRCREIGLLGAVGLSQKQVFQIWIREMLLVCLVGAIVGSLIGIGYAALLIHGLKTWWVGAIAKPIIDLHVGPISIIAGIVGGIAVCAGTIAWVLRSVRRRPTRALLTGEMTAVNSTAAGAPAWLLIAAMALLVVAVFLAALATKLYGDAQAGAFMGAGFCVLTALLMLVFRHLKTDGNESPLEDFRQMASSTLKRNPLRSTLTVGLVAVASFLIISVSAFRLAPSEKGTAGFDYVAQSSQPVVVDLGSAAGQQELLGDAALTGDVEIYGLRLKPGEDASCNNLYQSTQPRVLGIPQGLIQRFDESQQVAFAWGGSIATSDEEQANPWTLLNRASDDGAIPVIIDKNTANYSLKIFAPGGEYKVHFDSGETVTFRVVGFLSNTILQGSLLISEENFVRAFPYIGGSRYFLIDDPAEGSANVAILEKELSDQGFDAKSADVLLTNFMSVQNTYLSTFQTLGALGLLLGTIGLAAVQIRNIFERQQELGLLRAVGYSGSRIRSMIFGENLWLLGVGLGVGVLAALCCTVPHFLFGSASVPWLSLVLMFAVIIVIGLLTSLWATRTIGRMNLLKSLRN